MATLNAIRLHLAASSAAWRLGGLIVVLLVSACASLPDTRQLRAQHAQVARAADSSRSSYERGREIAGRVGASGRAEDFLAYHLAVEEAVSGAPLVPGNRVALLTDGEAVYREMLEAISRARRYVHMETYIFEDDEQGRRFADALIAARARNVQVALMVDAVGTMSTPDALFDRLRQAGVLVAVFNPLNPAEARAGWSPNQRNHRKVLVVDGEVGFLGGMNISSVYASGSLSDAGEQTRGTPWRDTHMAIRGPGVAELERILRDGWESQGGPPLPQWITLRPPPRQGDLVVRVLANDPQHQDGYTVYLTLMSAFASAQKSIHITMAYFVPDPAFLEVLEQAARRGVDVVLILPGFSDFSLVFHAGRSHYERLLRAGVKIYERRDALLHAKTAVVDGVWSTVGSSNLDWRSFALNYEINAVILGADFGRQMEAQFARDLGNAVPVRLQDWRRRGLDDRFMEVFSRLFERWL